MALSCNGLFKISPVRLDDFSVLEFSSSLLPDFVLLITVAWEKLSGDLDLPKVGYAFRLESGEPGFSLCLGDLDPLGCVDLGDRERLDDICLLGDLDFDLCFLRGEYLDCFAGGDRVLDLFSFNCGETCSNVSLFLF